MRAAHMALAEGRRVIVKAGELIEARFARGASPSLAARKVLALLIEKASGDAWRPGAHSITKKELRGSHESNDRLNDTLDELMAVTFKMPTISTRGRDAVLTAALISWNIEETDDDGMATVEWEFSEPARQMLQGSDYYARINRAALLALQSKYAVTVFEIGCLLIGKKNRTWSGGLEELREKLGVPHHAFRNFADLRRFVLKPTKAEIDQIAHFTFDWVEKRAPGRGRRITEVELCFTPKRSPAVNAAAAELERPRIGREARRDGTVEHLRVVAGRDKPELAAPLAFPSGSIRFGAQDLCRLAQDHGGGWDVDLIADAYRTHMGDKLASLTDAALLGSWEGFCKSYAARRPRP
ncbi:MAG: replication initiation protein [Rhizorhabdus sp.]